MSLSTVASFDMKLHPIAVLALVLAVLAGSGASVPSQKQEAAMPSNLGAFSVSLAVKDLKASRAFYETLGFKSFAGDASQNWLILQNGTTTIGLFQGMFEKNIMTFNPGWNSSAQPLKEFEDVRAIQKRLEGAGLKLTTRADEASTGPASITLADPDGNQILFDQHVPKPAK